MCRSRNYCFKLRSAFLMLLLMICSSFCNTVYALTPTLLDSGLYAATAQILKANLPELRSDNIFLPYTGQEQILDDFRDAYADRGTVHYKISENGPWIEGLPSFKDVGNYDIYYYIEGDENHANLGDINNPKKMSISIVAPLSPKETWGREVNNNGHINYVSNDGMTSAEVDKNGVIWIKEESYDPVLQKVTSAWYGVDNSSGVFKLGSRFWVKWLSEDDPEYAEYLPYVDSSHIQQAEDGKLWIFLTGVTSPEGVDYTNLDVNIPYYIQLGDDWDEEDVKAAYISRNEDENVDVTFGTVVEFNSKIENINFPETTGSYAQLLLRHFSPYLVYDRYDANKDSKKEKLDLPRLSSDTFNLKYQDKNKITDEFKKAYENKGTVISRITSHGAGDWLVGYWPTVWGVGSYDIYYYVKGNEDYNDLGSMDHPLHVKLKVEVDKSGWGREVNNNGHINYVDSYGMTSAEVDKYGVIWLKEESNGTSAWYGVDNSGGIFKLGSRFWVKWLSEDDPEYAEYLPYMDPSHIQQAEDGKLWIFLTGVTSPDGIDYTNLNVEIPYYIQLGDDWDEDDVKAAYISTGEDEDVPVMFGTVAKFSSLIENINFPETTGSYARLLLKHFSPYFIYDKKNASNIYQSNSLSSSLTTQTETSSKLSSKTNASAQFQNTGDTNSDIKYVIYIFVISLMLLFTQIIKKLRNNGKNEFNKSFEIKSVNILNYQKSKNKCSNHIVIFIPWLYHIPFLENRMFCAQTRLPFGELGFLLKVIGDDNNARRNYISFRCHKCA